MSLGPYESAPWLFKYAILYRKVAECSGGAIGPDVVDTWESWQCASFLGVGLPLPKEAQPGTASDTAVSPTMQAHIEWLQARDRGEDVPPPEPTPINVSDMGGLMATFEGR